MKWPEPGDYHKAIQNPPNCFVDPDLKIGNVRTNSRGLPHGISGQFATVYEIFTTRKAWAVRCFLRQVPDQQKRYETVHNYLNSRTLPNLVSFEYLTDGIGIVRDSSGGRRRCFYPVLKMEWVAGRTLDMYVQTKLLEGSALLTAAENFHNALNRFCQERIAHGDLQHANILVRPDGSLAFVDYDAMFVPPLRGRTCPEMGLRNFQHPARTGCDYNESLDNFSALVIFTSLRALAYDPLLWKFHSSENLILSEADFRHPSGSPVFQQLTRSCDAGVLTLAQMLQKACGSRLSDVEPLHQIVSKIPSPSAIPHHKITSQQLANLINPAPPPISSFSSTSRRTIAATGLASQGWRVPQAIPQTLPAATQQQGNRSRQRLSLANAMGWTALALVIASLFVNPLNLFGFGLAGIAVYFLIDYWRFSGRPVLRGGHKAALGVIGLLALIIVIAVLERTSARSTGAGRGDSRSTSQPANRIPSRDFYAEWIDGARRAVQVKNWDEAYSAADEALKIKPSGPEALSIRNDVLSSIRDDKQYFGRSFRKIRSFQKAASAIRNMDFDADGTFLTTRHVDGTVQEWSFKTGELVSTRQLGTSLHVQKYLDFRFAFEKRSLDGTAIARVEPGLGIACDVTILNAYTGTQMSKRRVEGEFFEVSPDLMTVVAVTGWLLSFDPTMEFIDLATGRVIRRINADGQWIPRFTPDGNWLAIGRHDGRVDVWGISALPESTSSNVQTDAATRPENVETRGSAAEHRGEQMAAIKTPQPGEWTEFEMTVYPGEWSYPIQVPAEYKYDFTAVGRQGRIWWMPDGDANRSVEFGPQEPRRLGRTSSIQYKSGESFPLRIRTRLQPPTPSEEKKTFTKWAGPWSGSLVASTDTPAGSSRDFMVILNAWGHPQRLVLGGAACQITNTKIDEQQIQFSCSRPADPADYRFRLVPDSEGNSVSVTMEAKDRTGTLSKSSGRLTRIGNPPRKSINSVSPTNPGTAETSGVPPLAQQGQIVKAEGTLATTSRPIPFHGLVSSVDHDAGTFTIAGRTALRTFKVTSETAIIGGMAAPTINDLVPNAEVSGSYWKTDDGSLQVKTLKIKTTSKRQLY